MGVRVSSRFQLGSPACRGVGFTCVSWCSDAVGVEVGESEPDAFDMF